MERYTSSRIPTRGFGEILQQFRAAASQVNEMGAALQKSVTDPGARQATEKFVHTYVAMRVKYEAALQVFTRAKGATHTTPITW